MIVPSSSLILFLSCVLLCISYIRVAIPAPPPALAAAPFPSRPRRRNGTGWGRAKQPRQAEDGYAMDRYNLLGLPRPSIGRPFGFTIRPFLRLLFLAAGHAHSRTPLRLPVPITHT